MTNYPFTLQGYENIPFSFQPGDMTGGIKILCDGKPMKRVWGKYKTTLPNGEEIVLGLKYNWDIFNPKITFKKQVIAVTPSLPTYQMVFTYLPLILVAGGGPIGGLCGGVAAYINFSIFRGKSPVPVKIILSIVMFFIAIVVYSIAASHVRAAIQ